MQPDLVFFAWEDFDFYENLVLERRVVLQRIAQLSLQGYV